METTTNIPDYKETPESSTWVTASEVSPLQKDSAGRDLHNHKEDITLDNNVWIGGILRANRIVHPWGCLFVNEDALMAEYPHPRPGMWAIVGSVYPFDTYRCRVDGEWEIADKQSVISQITDCLSRSNYATELWVENQISKIGGLDESALKLYLNSNKYVTQNWIEQYYSNQSIGSLEKLLPRLEFEEMFEWVERNGQRFIRAKSTIVADGDLVSLYAGEDIGITSYATTEMLKPYVTKDILEERLKGFNTGLDIEELQQYLSTHNYITSTALNGYALSTDIPSLDGYYDSKQVDSLVSDVERKINKLFRLVEKDGQQFIETDFTFVSKGDLVSLYAGEQLDIPTYITSEALEARLKELNVGSGGLDMEALQSYLTENAYATQDWVKRQGFLTGLTGYATEQWVTSQGYLKSIESVNVLDIRDTDNAPNLCDFKKATFWFNNKGVPQEPYWFSGITVNGWASSTYNVWQIASNAHPIHINENLYFRCGLGNSWENWRKIWDSGNMGAGSGLDADMLDGLHAQSLFIKGVGRLTDASQFDTIYNCQTNVIYSLNGMFEEPYGTVLTFNSGLYNFGGQFFLPRGPSTSSHIFYRGKTDLNNAWSQWRKLAFLDDNVASATKLATARTIWGRSFDGTTDITGQINAIGGESHFAGTSYTDPATGVGAAVKITGALAQSGGNVLLATTSGYVGIGKTNPSYPLDVNGDICTRSGRIYLTPSVWIEYDAANDIIRSNKTFASKGDIAALTT